MSIMLFMWYYFENNIQAPFPFVLKKYVQLSFYQLKGIQSYIEKKQLFPQCIFHHLFEDCCIQLDHLP